jgi:Xaa-Pro aminopeptidase
VNLIDLDLLEAKEKKLLNEYHQRVWDNVSPLLIASKSSALDWLKARTAAI